MTLMLVLKTVVFFLAIFVFIKNLRIFKISRYFIDTQKNLSISSIGMPLLIMCAMPSNVDCGMLGIVFSLTALRMSYDIGNELHQCPMAEMDHYAYQERTKKASNGVKASEI